jgi:hypothetical protein
VNGERIRGSRAGLLLLLIFLLLLCGCGQGPSEVARDYLDNLKLGRYQACYQMLSRRDRLAQTLEQFLTDMPLAPDVDRAWFEAIEGKTQYVLSKQARVHGLKAVISVTVTTVDLPLWERALESIYGPSAAPHAARKSLAQDAYPRLSYDDELVLVKESHHWRLFADLAAHERIARLHREALHLYHEHRFDESVQIYNTLLEALENPPASGAKGAIFHYSRELALVKAARANVDEASLYRSRLRLTKVARQMTASGEPGMFGLITNTGDRPVDEVRVTVSYYFGEGTRRSLVFAANHVAIANPLEFTGFQAPPAPLMPGETRSFGLRLNAPTLIEEDATPELRIASLIFSPWSAQTLTAVLSGIGVSPTRHDHLERSVSVPRSGLR